MGRHYERGLALYELRRFREAAAEFTQELAERPECSFTFGTLALCLIQTADFDDAEAAARRSIALEPDSPYGHYVYALVMMKRRRLADAESHLLEAGRLGINPEILQCLAAIYVDTRRLDKAMAATSQALALDPRHVSSLLLRAKAFMASGDDTATEYLLRQALEVEPEHPGVHRALGELSLKDGDAETAIDFYFEARRIDPVRHNDRLGLLRAHTQLVWPFKHLLPLIHRLRRWPHSRQWTLYAATSTAVVGLLVLVQSSVLPWYVPPLVVLLAVNIVLLVHTGNKLADCVGIWCYGRQLQLPRLAYLDSFVMLGGNIWIHFFVTMLAGIVTLSPSSCYLALGGLLMWDAMWLLHRGGLAVSVVSVALLGTGLFLLLVSGVDRVTPPWMTLVYWTLLCVVSAGLVHVRGLVESRPAWQAAPF